jgi:sugar (pentulose or hexulose) kinase
VLGRAYSEFTQHFPRSGWVEHDASEIWEVTRRVAREALDAADGADVRGIGITNQRETVVLWDRETLEPVHRAIVWQDRRTTQICRELERAGHEAAIRERTGLVIDPYFSGTKVTWLLREHPELRERAEAGELALGTIDSWLIARLTNGRVHATDPTNASRTMLYDLEKAPLGPLGARPARSAGLDAAGGPAERGQVRRRVGRAPRDRGSGLGGGGRPTGRALRAGVLADRDGEEHVRNRGVSRTAHGG